ncbi:MAG TPA: hypothetical protein VJT31_32610 [Rugosimonospora sp.]|nr:hypothetical protein [Rugosimonospora sp.]
MIPTYTRKAARWLGFATALVIATGVTALLSDPAHAASGGGCGTPATTSFGSIKACISEGWPNVYPDAYLSVGSAPSNCGVVIYLLNASSAVNSQDGPFPCVTDHDYGPADNVFRSSKWRTKACFTGAVTACSLSPWQIS